MKHTLRKGKVPREAFVNGWQNCKMNNFFSLLCFPLIYLLKLNLMLLPF